MFSLLPLILPSLSVVLCNIALPIVPAAADLACNAIVVADSSTAGWSLLQKKGSVIRDRARQQIDQCACRVNVGDTNGISSALLSMVHGIAMCDQAHPACTPELSFNNNPNCALDASNASRHVDCISNYFMPKIKQKAARVDQEVYPPLIPYYTEKPLSLQFRAYGSQLLHRFFDLRKPSDVPIINGSTIGVQIRSSDWVEGGTCVPSITAYVKRTLKHLRAGDKIYLAADSKEVKEKFIKEFHRQSPKPNEIITSDVYVSRLNNKGRDGWMVSRAPEDRLRQAEGAWKDVVNLSQCRELIFHDGSTALLTLMLNEAQVARHVKCAQVARRRRRHLLLSQQARHT